MSRLRKVIAERAVVSMQTSAQLTSVVEVDVTRVAHFRDDVKDQFLRETGVKLSFLPFFALAAAEALRAYPIVNATIDGDSIVYPDHENISIAVDTERGLLTPVMRNAAGLTLADFAKQIADLAEPHPREQAQARRTRRRNVHDHEHRFTRRAVRHPDRVPAAVGNPRNRNRRQEACGRQRQRARCHRYPFDRLPRPVV